MVVAALAALLAGGCKPSESPGMLRPTPVPVPVPQFRPLPYGSSTTFDNSRLYFSSEADHAIVRGRTLDYSMQSASFQGSVGRSGGFIRVSVFPTDGPGPWMFTISAPLGEVFRPGTFATVRLSDPQSNGADFSGDGRGCSGVGTVTIHALSYDLRNGALNHLRASFEHRCEGATPRMLGELAYLADPPR